MKTSVIDRLIFKALKQERSFSQCGEDKILKHLFAGFGKDRITYLDIGANHPVVHNNTYFFYRNGSSGVCVEPNPVLATLIRRTRRKDVCLNIGVTPADDSVADFYQMSSHSLSTFCREDAEDLEASGDHRIEDVLTIQVRNINSIIKENFDDSLDLVSIDVEGWNGPIVESLDFDYVRPFCLCIETITFSDSHLGEKITPILEYMQKNDYAVYADTHINTIFVDNRSGATSRR